MSALTNVVVVFGMRYMHVMDGICIITPPDSQNKGLKMTHVRIQRQQGSAEYIIRNLQEIPIILVRYLFKNSKFQGGHTYQESIEMGLIYVLIAINN